MHTERAARISMPTLTFVESETFSSFIIHCIDAITTSVSQPTPDCCAQAHLQGIERLSLFKHVLKEQLREKLLSLLIRFNNFETMFLLLF